MPKVIDYYQEHLRRTNCMSRAQEFIEKRLHPPLLHGNEEHQQWLREEILKWIPDLEELLRQVESRPVVLDWRDYDPTRILG